MEYYILFFHKILFLWLWYKTVNTWEYVFHANFWEHLNVKASFYDQTTKLSFL